MRGGFIRGNHKTAARHKAMSILPDRVTPRPTTNTTTNNQAMTTRPGVGSSGRDEHKTTKKLTMRDDTMN